MRASRGVGKLQVFCYFGFLAATGPTNHLTLECTSPNTAVTASRIFQRLYGRSFSSTVDGLYWCSACSCWECICGTATIKPLPRDCSDSSRRCSVSSSRFTCLSSCVGLYCKQWRIWSSSRVAQPSSPRGTLCRRQLEVRLIRQIRIQSRKRETIWEQSLANRTSIPWDSECRIDFLTHLNGIHGL